MIWVIVAVFIVSVLLVIAGYYLFQIRQLRQRQSEERIRREAKLEEKRRDARRSIVVLLRALKARQLTATEASIRIVSLLQVLPDTERGLHSYAVFRDLAEKTAHIPILDEWKKLSSHEKRSFDKDREQFESEVQGQITVATDALLTLQ